MVDLLSFKAKICTTAAGMVIHQGKVLLVRHRKLGFWLCPGGHMEVGEMPHQAALREVLEESGVKATILSPYFARGSKEVQYLPVPLEVNLHWVNQAGYQNRVENPTGYRPSPIWPRGCEQHVGHVFLMKLKGRSSKVTIDKNESTDIGWFTLTQVRSFYKKNILPKDVYLQIQHGFAAVK